jgi:hypothetical protein
MIVQDFIAKKEDIFRRCHAQECGDQVCVAGFNDGKCPAAEEGVQGYRKDALFLEWLPKQPRVIRLEVHALVCNTLLN